MSNTLRGYSLMITGMADLNPFSIVSEISDWNNQLISLILLVFQSISYKFISVHSRAFVK